MGGIRRTWEDIKGHRMTSKDMGEHWKAQHWKTLEDTDGCGSNMSGNM